MWVVAREGVGLGSGSLGCRAVFFCHWQSRHGVRRLDGFVGESLLQSLITRALAPDCTSVGACVIPHGHGHGLGALGLGVGWGLGLCAGCSLALALALAWGFFREGLLGRTWERVPPGSRYLP